MARAKHKLPYGEGSFYRRSDGMWVGAISAGWNATGHRRRITVKAKDEQRAWDKLQTVRKRILAGEQVTPRSLTTRVATFATTWITDRQKHVRPKTWATDASVVRHWIIPTLGRKRLADLTAADVRTLGNRVLEAGRSSTTARYTERIFQEMCRHAQAQGLTVPQPVLLAQKDEARVSDRTAIPTDQAIRLLQVAAKRPDAARWVAALLQGMRQGECLGLTWSAVDFDRHELDISWQLQPLPYADRDRDTFKVPQHYEARRLTGAWHLVRPKTQHGQRIIPMVPWMESALAAWRKTAPTNPWGLVWARPDPLPQSADTDRAAWRTLQDEAHVWKHPPTKKRRPSYFVLHEARNTTATLLLNAGVDPEIITSILGHSSITTSRGYMRVGEEQKRAALEAVANQLKLQS